jgi:hypothetical protein
MKGRGKNGVTISDGRTHVRAIPVTMTRGCLQISRAGVLNGIQERVALQDGGWGSQLVLKTKLRNIRLGFGIEWIF